MQKILFPVQPVTQQVIKRFPMKSNYQQAQQPVIQREMPFFMKADNSQFAPASVVDSWANYRDSVIWCWANRPHRGMNEPDDQSMFSRNAGIHAPHMSRFVSNHSKAPMDLRPDLIPCFEAYTGWRGITQYLAKHSNVTLMEEVIEARRAA